MPGSSPSPARNASPSPGRPGLSWKLVGAGFAGLLVVGLVAAVFIYFRLIRYERTAAAHLPDDTAFALRVDVEQGIVYEPFREHLLPLVNQGRAEQASGEILAARLERIKTTTGIELGVDMREFVLSRGKTWADWVLAVGGKFPKSGVVAKLGRVLAEEGHANTPSEDGSLVVLASGAAIGQASDGVLLFASSRGRLEQALPAPAHPPVELASDGAIAFAWRGAPLLTEYAPALAGVTRVSGRMKLADVPELVAELYVAPGRDAALVRAELEGLGRTSGVAAPEIAAASGVLRSARVTISGPSLVRVVGPWPRSELDRAAETLANWVKTVLFP